MASLHHFSSGKVRDKCDWILFELSVTKETEIVIKKSIDVRQVGDDSSKVRLPGTCALNVTTLVNDESYTETLFFKEK